MSRRRTNLLIVSLVAALSARLLVAQNGTDCSPWRECQQLALAAADRGDFETFHDYAWRVVQKGPRNDPALMFLLARAQSLSGRPHDAIVMLQRIADMGALAPEAIANDDFRRARELPAWTDLEARVAGHAAPNSMRPPGAPRASGVVPAPAARASDGTAAAPVASPTALSAATEAVRFRSAPFALGGVAYDAVSQRFLLGDRRGRKVIVVGERSDHSVDLARAASGGFRDVAALEIDARRGDLWVASAGDPGGAGLLHKLQLISGRTLKSYPIDVDGAPVVPADLAVTRSGAVLVLDAGAPQLVMLRPGQGSVERIARIKEADLSSVTVGDDEDVAYVAHAGGISRVSVRTGATTAVSLPPKAQLGHVERIRWHQRTLIAIEQMDGARRVVRLALNDRGTSVTQSTLVADHLPGSGRVYVAISGDELVYVLDPDPAAQSASPEDVVVYRVRLN